MANETDTTGTPPAPETAAPGKEAPPETKDAPAAGADGGAATPAPALSPEQIRDLQEKGRRWDAVNPFFRETETGDLELKPEALPRTQKETDPIDDPEAAAAARAAATRRAEMESELATRTSQAANAIEQDLTVQRSLEDELKAEAGGDLIMAHARSIMKRVPIEKRNEQAWRQALLLGRGATEKQRREHWIKDGRRQAEEDLEKVHGLRIPRPVPKAKTEEEMVAELTPAQKRYCERAGMDPKKFAKRQEELRGGRQ